MPPEKEPPLARLAAIALLGAAGGYCFDRYRAREQVVTDNVLVIPDNEDLDAVLYVNGKVAGWE